MTGALEWTELTASFLAHLDTGPEGVVVCCAGDKAGAKIATLDRGAWWGNDGFQLMPQPTHFLANSRIPHCPRA